MKYTEPGGSVTVLLERDGDDTVLTVRDTGIGMTEQEVEHVCARFFRGEGALRREIPGTGLGLNRFVHRRRARRQALRRERPGARQLRW